LIQLVMMIFIPIMGRRGPAGNPDIILGVASAIFTILLLQFVFPILISIKKQFFLRSCCITLFSLTVLAITILGRWFPYSSDPLHPTPQRISAYHTARTIHSVSDGGILVGGWDYAWYSRLQDQVPAYRTAQRTTPATCDIMLGCGLPMHGRTIQGSMDSVWINSSIPRIDSARQTLVQVVSREVSGGKTNLTLSVSGPSRIVLLLGARIVAWSISDSLQTSLEWGGVPVHYVQLVRGVGHHPHQLWVVLEGDQDMVVSVTGHYNHGQDMVGPAFKQFLDTHPPWVSFAAWTVDYKYYLINTKG